MPDTCGAVREADRCKHGLLEAPNKAPPHPGAKDWFLIDGQLEDSDVLRVLSRATAKAPPAQKPKKKAAAKKQKARSAK